MDESIIKRETEWLFNKPYEEVDTSYRNKEWLRCKIEDEQLTHEEIATICNVERGTIWKWCRELNIKNPRRHGKDITLTDELREIIEGGLLGDGCLAPTKVASGLTSARYVHSSVHEDYVLYLKDFFPLYFWGNINIIAPKHKNKQTAYQLRSRAFKNLLDEYYRWYPDGEKIVPDDLVLTPRSLLILFMDDGYFQKRTQNSYAIRIANGFNYEDTERLAKMVEELIGTKLNIYGHYSENSSYEIRTHNVNAFFSAIGDCPVKCFEYKWRDGNG